MNLRMIHFFVMGNENEIWGKYYPHASLFSNKDLSPSQWVYFQNHRTWELIWRLNTLYDDISFPSHWSKATQSLLAHTLLLGISADIQKNSHIQPVSGSLESSWVLISVLPLWCGRSLSMARCLIPSHVSHFPLGKHLDGANPPPSEATGSPLPYLLTYCH